MDIELTLAPRAAASALENLFQYYVYDFSALVGMDVAEDGKFARRSLELYWQDPWRHAFLARVAGRYAGFALVHQRSYLNADPSVSDVAEFFVLRKYRRQGVGAALARHVFEFFPGRWEVRQLTGNDAATRFWRKVIADFTRGCFEEEELSGEHFRGLVQRFDNTRVPPE